MNSELIITLAIIASINLVILAKLGKKIRIRVKKGCFSINWERNGTGKQHH